MVVDKNFANYLKRAADSGKGVHFIVSPGGDSDFWPYSRLFSESRRSLAALQSVGMVKGSELVLLTEEPKVFMPYFWGALLGGIVAVPLKISKREEDLLRFDRALPKLRNPYILVSGTYAAGSDAYARIKSILPNGLEGRLLEAEKLSAVSGSGVEVPVGSDDIAIVQFSSGSTGEPRGVSLTHRNLNAAVPDIAESSAIDSDDFFLSWLPLTHNMGLIGMHLTPVIAIADQGSMPAAFFMQNPLSWIVLADKFRATRLCGPNFAYLTLESILRNMSKSDRRLDIDLSRVREVYNGSEPVSMDMMRNLTAALAPFGFRYDMQYPVYGMAEATLGITFPLAGTEPQSVVVNRKRLNIGDAVDLLKDKSAPDALECAVVGRRLRHCEIAIVGGEGERYDDMRVGSVCIRGECLSPGYYGENEALADDDGWYSTGDIGFTVGGQLVVSGRQKEIIFVNGQNFFPFDVERVCVHGAGLKPGSVAACGRFNAALGRNEMIIFVVAIADSPQWHQLADSLRSIVWDQLGASVDMLIAVDSLPLSAGTKVARYKLIENLEAGLYSEPSVDAAATVGELSAVDQITRVVAAALGLQSIDPDANIADMGVTSIIAIKIFNELQNSFQGRLKLADFYARPTVSRLAELVESAETLDDPKETTVIVPTVVEDALAAVSKRNGVTELLVAACFIGSLLSEKLGQSSVTVYVSDGKGFARRAEFMPGNGDLDSSLRKCRKSLSKGTATAESDLPLKADAGMLVPLFYSKAARPSEFNPSLSSVGLSKKSGALTLTLRGFSGELCSALEAHLCSMAEGG